MLHQKIDKESANEQQAKIFGACYQPYWIKQYIRLYTKSVGIVVFFKSLLDKKTNINICFSKLKPVDLFISNSLNLIAHVMGRTGFFLLSFAVLSFS